MEIELPDGTILEAPDDADPSAVAKAYLSNQSTPERPARTNLQELKRQLGLTARIGADTVAALPLAAMDAGIGARNLLTGSNYDSASKMYGQAMDSVLPRPESGIEKGVNLAGQMMLGSKMPAPQAASQAPPNFANFSMKQQALHKAAQDGYAVPPSTVNPSMTNRVLESIGGKVAMEQDASLKNQDVTNRLVRRAIGLPEDEMLSGGALDVVRRGAGKVYDDISKTDDVQVDQTFVDAISRLPKSVVEDVAPRVSAKVDSSAGGAIRRGYETVPASRLLQQLRELRFDSQRNLSPMAAQNPESAKLGRAQKEAADQLEELLMRHLRGNGASKLADNFAEARKLIAKTHTVEDALNEVTGEVTATKLSQQLAKGKPLSGDLKKVAEFATAFPKAAKLVLDSGSVRNTDVILGAGTAIMAKEPTYLLYPFLRQAVRQGLLSDTGQRVLTNPGLRPHPGAATTLAYGTAAANGLLGQ